MRKRLKFIEIGPTLAASIVALTGAIPAHCEPTASTATPVSQAEFAVLRASDGSPRFVPFTVRGQDAVVSNVLPIGNAQVLRRTTAALLQSLGRDQRTLGDPLQAEVMIDALRHRPNLMATVPALVCFKKDWCWPDTHIYYQIQPTLATATNKGGHTMKLVIEGALKEISASSGGAWSFCSVDTLDPKQAKKLNKPRLFFQLSNDDCSSARGYDAILEDGFNQPHFVNLKLTCGVPKTTPNYTDVFSVVHEVFHALGFSHAHQNPAGPAEKVLTVDTSNIADKQKKNFLVFADSPWASYDFCSVMHYSWNEYFSADYFKNPAGSKEIFKVGPDMAAVQADMQACTIQWQHLPNPPHAISPPYDEHTLVGQRYFISDIDKQLLTALANLSTSSGQCNDKSDFADK
jgi:hypothetical protein